MIKGIILDVDGVIVGDKSGFNWPDPNPQVIEALSALRKQGIIISLCTAKGAFAIKQIVKAANLDNLHVGDGGAVVMDFINNKIIDKHVIPQDLCIKTVIALKQQNVYLELYGIDKYFVEKNQVAEITKKHTDILHQKPILVDSLIEVIKESEIIKIMPIVYGAKERDKLQSFIASFGDELTFQWGIHPSALPAQFVAITVKSVSKNQAAKNIAKNYNIPLEEFLGVGDGMTDWAFIQLCGYKGVMGNASDELKKMINPEGKNSFVGKDVNHNGLLSIFRYFKLI